VEAAEVWWDVFFMIRRLRVLSETLHELLGTVAVAWMCSTWRKSPVAQIWLPSLSGSSGKLASRAGDGLDDSSSSSSASSTKAGKGPVWQAFICLVSFLFVFCSALWLA